MHLTYGKYKYIIMLIFCVVTYSTATSQSLKVKYDWLPLDYHPVHTANFSMSMTPIRLFLYLNDSYGYLYKPDCSWQVGSKKVTYRDFYDLKKGKNSYLINCSRKAHYLVAHKTASRQWQFVDGQKTILHQACKLAISVNEKNDSVCVWYTTDLHCNQSSLYHYDDIPGVILELIDRKYDIHITAKKIRHVKKTISYPADAEKISWVGWLKLQQGIKPAPEDVEN